MTLSLGFLGVSCGIHVCPRKTFHHGGNLINAVYLSCVLSACSALMTGRSLLRGHHFSLFATAPRLQPEGESGGGREADILGQTPENFFHVPLEHLILFLNLLPVMEDYFLLQQNPFITLIPEDEMHAQQALG